MPPSCGGTTSDRTAVASIGHHLPYILSTLFQPVRLTITAFTRCTLVTPKLASSVVPYPASPPPSMSANGRGPVNSARNHSHTTVLQVLDSKRPSTRATTSTSTLTHSDDLHLTVTDPHSDADSTQPDAFDQLCSAIEARLQLTSQCMLLLTRILQQLTRNHNPSTSSLLPSLAHSLTDADATHAELLTLYERLTRVKLDRRLDGRVRKEKRRRREQIEQDVIDVSARFSQIKTLANAKLNHTNGSEHNGTKATYGAAASHYQPPSATRDTQPLLSSYHATSSPTEDDASTSLPASYQTTELLSPTQQELYDAEADAVQRSVFIEQVERDVSTLHDMFVDMHTMVGEQGHIANSLESIIGRSADKVREGLGEVLKAEEYARRRRGRLCCCGVLGGVMLSIVVLVLYALSGSAG